jgi:hypothetical protein
MRKFIGIAPCALGVCGVAWLAACCPARFGELRGQWVYVAAPGAAGVAAAPWHGSPLELEQAAAPCLASRELDQHFGETCEAHETEGGAQSEAGAATDLGVPPPLLEGDVPLGNQPTVREVRWYCDRHTVLRVVLDRCDASTFRPVQIAVSTRRGA